MARRALRMDILMSLSRKDRFLVMAVKAKLLSLGNQKVPVCRTVRKMADLATAAPERTMQPPFRKVQVMTLETEFFSRQ